VSAEQTYVVLASEPGLSVAAPDVAGIELWRPSPSGLRPPAVTGAGAYVWAAFHTLHLFSNRDYAAVLIREGGEPVHRSYVFPRWARFPFMAADDLQIGDTWTAPAARGRGLARLAIRAALAHFARPGRRFWYVAAADNHPSIRAAEGAGLRRVAVAHRTAPFGVRLVGRYELAPDPAGALALP
jgi:RimJ/RimL family protein N-acetyltransferase